MSYDYKTERPRLFTEEGVAMLMKIRARAEQLLASSGAFMAQNALRDVSGTSWTMSAALDYLCEQKVIREVHDPNAWGQHKVYTAYSVRP